MLTGFLIETSRREEAGKKKVAFDVEGWQETQAERWQTDASIQILRSESSETNKGISKQPAQRKEWSTD